MARALGDRRLTVLAVSLPTAVALAEHSQVRLIVPGGEVRRGELAMSGDGAVSAISALRFDAVVLAACGLGDAAVTAYDLGDAAVKRALIESSARVIVAADSSKFARVGMAVVCRTDQIDVLVTDVDAPPAAVSTLRAAGVEVVCV